MWLPVFGRCDLANREAVPIHAVERRSECLHVRDLARHQELQGVLRTDIVAEIDEAFVDDLGAGLSGDVAAQIHVELAGYLEVIGCPRIAHGIEEIDATTPGNGDQGSTSANSRLNFIG